MKKWADGKEPAFFFLDAVDESRLQGSVALGHALTIIMQALSPHLARVSVLLSSRISDWQLDAVRAAVSTHVLVPLLRSAETALTSSDGKVLATAIPQPTFSVQPFRLAPLSKNDATRLAAANGAEPIEAFWSAIRDGDYDFMVAHPRDVEWLARRWSRARALGSYTELIEDQVTQRLVEHNDTYISAGEALSTAMLREGAERLAAASLFCASPYISLPGDDNVSNDLDPAEVLSEWDSRQHRRLLGVAVFDEATFGRVKFYHRTTREYLAASWVHGRLNAGLPLADAMALFGGISHGERVLLEHTRAALCWLAAINVHAREYVVRYFPEMLMYEGDPEAWSTADVTDAFDGYIERLRNGYRPNWWNGISEMRRVALRIPAEVLCKALRRVSGRTAHHSPAPESDAAYGQHQVHRRDLGALPCRTALRLCVACASRLERDRVPRTSFGVEKASLCTVCQQRI